MSNPNYPATSLAQAVDLTIEDANLLHDVINADSTTTIEVDDGPIPSLRKSLIDNFYYIDPIAWNNGSPVTKFNQLVKFTDGTLWLAPTASTTNPILMGVTPVGDSLWKLSLYSADIQAIARSLNVKEAEVLYSTDVVTILDGVLYIYDKPDEITYNKPSNVGVGEVIVSVSGNTLTTNAATYQMRQVVTKTINFTKHDVSLPFGNTIVESLNGPFEFTRLSTTGNINKSGVVETLAIDEPAITSKGMSVYESFINKALHTEDFSGTKWGNSTATRDKAYSAPDGSSDATLFTVIDANSIQIFQSVVFTANDANLSIFAKAGTSHTLTLRYVSYDTSITEQFNLQTKIATGEGEIEELDDEWFRCSLPAEFTGVDLNGSIYCYIATNEGTAFSGDVGNTMYIWGGQATATNVVAPYIKTTTVPVARAADIASIPVMTNMPSAGKQFTIIVDVEDLPLDSEHVIFSIDTDLFFRRSGSNNKIQFFTGGVSVLSSSDYDATGVHRFSVVFDGVNIKLFDNGVLLDSSAATPTYSVNASMLIGSLDGGVQYLNSELKNFEIIHSALSDEELAVRGVIG